VVREWLLEEDQVKEDLAEAVVLVVQEQIHHPQQLLVMEEMD
tara:strand:- start:182 stop:307 length:126 start_codon:yes stop_codon:yes gene_type:complete